MPDTRGPAVKVAHRDPAGVVFRVLTPLSMTAGRGPVGVRQPAIWPGAHGRYDPASASVVMRESAHVATVLGYQCRGHSHDASRRATWPR